MQNGQILKLYTRFTSRGVAYTELHNSVTNRLMQTTEHSIIEDNVKIGANCRIWFGSHVRTGAKIGSGTSIGEHCFIDHDVYIGKNCKIQNGVQIYHGVVIGDNVFIGPNTTFCNDKYPDAVRDGFTLSETVILNEVSIGAGCTILPGLTINSCITVGAGSVVTKTLDSRGSTYYGNPARLEKE